LSLVILGQENLSLNSGFYSKKASVWSDPAIPEIQNKMQRQKPTPLILTQEIIMNDKVIDKGGVVAILNNILETELAGVVRYTHYALMVYGYSRIPTVS
jgi:hypothetical protein